MIVLYFSFSKIVYIFNFVHKINNDNLLVEKIKFLPIYEHFIIRLSLIIVKA